MQAVKQLVQEAEREKEREKEKMRLQGGRSGRLAAARGEGGRYRSRWNPPQQRRASRGQDWYVPA